MTGSITYPFGGTVLNPSGWAGWAVAAPTAPATGSVTVLTPEQFKTETGLDAPAGVANVLKATLDNSAKGSVEVFEISAPYSGYADLSTTKNVTWGMYVPDETGNRVDSTNGLRFRYYGSSAGFRQTRYMSVAKNIPGSPLGGASFTGISYVHTTPQWFVATGAENNEQSYKAIWGNMNTGQPGTQPSPGMNSIRLAMRLGIVANAPSSVVYLFEVVKDLAHTGSKKPFIFITVDDTNDDNYTNLFPIMRKYNIPHSFSAVASKWDTPGFLTTPQAVEMRDAGAEFTLHGEGQSGGTWNTWTVAQVAAEINANVAALKSKLTQYNPQWNQICVFPGNDYYNVFADQSLHIYQLLSQMGFKATRGNPNCKSWLLGKTLAQNPLMIGGFANVCNVTLTGNIPNFYAISDATTYAYYKNFILESGGCGGGLMVHLTGADAAGGLTITSAAYDSILAAIQADSVVGNIIPVPLSFVAMLTGNLNLSDRSLGLLSITPSQSSVTINGISTVSGTAAMIVKTDGAAAPIDDDYDEQPPITVTANTQFSTTKTTLTGGGAIVAGTPVDVHVRVR